FKAMRKLWKETLGQDIAEYAVMLAVILIVVIAALQIVGQTTKRNLDKAETRFNQLITRLDAVLSKDYRGEESTGPSRFHQVFVPASRNPPPRPTPSSRNYGKETFPYRHRTSWSGHTLERIPHAHLIPLLPGAAPASCHQS